MSKANSPIKVLRTALKRVNKGWMKSAWHVHVKDDDGGDVNYVCLEGAIYGYCTEEKHPVTAAQKKAIEVVRQIIRERTDDDNMDIPGFNDLTETNLEDIQEVIKLAMIRIETGGAEDGLDDQDADDLIKCMSKT